MIEINENVKIMKCSVIGTFDKLDEYGEKQEFLNIEVAITEEDKNLDSFIKNKLFKEIAEAFQKDKRGVKWLSMVSIACDWFVYETITKNVFDMNEINNGKWAFAECSSFQLTEGGLDWKLKQKYGFGTKCDSSWLWNNQNDRDKIIDAFLSYVHKNTGLEWNTENV